MKRRIFAALLAALTLLGGAAQAEEPSDESRARAAILLYLETEIPEEILGEASRREGATYRTVSFRTAEDEIVAVDLDDESIRRVVRSHTGEQDFVKWELKRWIEEWGCAWAFEDADRVNAMEPQMEAYLDAHGIVHEPWTGFVDRGAFVTYDEEPTTDIYLRFYYLVPGSDDLLSWRGSVRVLYSLYQGEICGVDLLPDSIG